MAVTEEEILNRVSTHRLNEQGATRIDDIRRQTEIFANVVRVLVPEGREQSLALTHIETAMFFANAGIARDPSMQAERERIGE